MFKALSRHDSETQSTRTKQPRMSIGRQTAGKVREALRIFSLPKDKKQHESSIDGAPKLAGCDSPKPWRASKLFRSDTPSYLSRTFSPAAPSSKWTRFGRVEGTPKAAVASEEPPVQRSLFATRYDNVDSVTTSMTRPTATPQMSISDIHPSPSDPFARLARWRGSSRNDVPQVRRAQCKLQQPKPVRASDMKRIVSLCKDKVSRRMLRGESGGRT